MKSQLKPLAVLLIAVTIFGLSCTKEADSKPQFIFKPGPNNETAAKINGEMISYDQLLTGLENDIYEAQMKVYEIKMNALRGLVIKKFMEADPKYKGDADKFLQENIANNIKVSDKEVDKFASERKIPKQNLNAQLKERIKDFLKKEKTQEAIDQWLATKTKDKPVEVYLNEPKRPVKDVQVGDAPYMGGSDATVTVVEFSDFQCPFCQRGAEIMTQLKKDYGKKVKIAFKHFPLPFHNHAKKAAEAAICAEELKKGHFWKMHDKMFADQSGLDTNGLVAKAKEIGLKEADFKKCLESGKFAAAVSKDMEQGKTVGVKSTPTFFVNGQLVNGAQPVEVFKKIIDAELAK